MTPNMPELKLSLNTRPPVLPPILHATIVTYRFTDAMVTSHPPARRDQCTNCRCTVGAGRAGRYCKVCRPIFEHI